MDSLPEAPGTIWVWMWNPATWLPHPDPDEVPNISCPGNTKHTEEQENDDGEGEHTLTSYHVPGPGLLTWQGWIRHRTTCVVLTTWSWFGEGLGKEICHRRGSLVLLRRPEKTSQESWCLIQFLQDDPGMWSFMHPIICEFSQRVSNIYLLLGIWLSTGRTEVPKLDSYTHRDSLTVGRAHQ